MAYLELQSSGKVVFREHGYPSFEIDAWRTTCELYTFRGGGPQYDSVTVPLSETDADRWKHLYEEILRVQALQDESLHDYRRQTQGHRMAQQQ